MDSAPTSFRRTEPPDPSVLLAEPPVWLWLGLVLATVFLALAAIWLPPIVPGQDTPHHVFLSAVLREPSRWATWYEVRSALTSQIFEEITSHLLWLGPVIATKVVRTIDLALLLLGAWLIGREQGVRRAPGLLFAAAASESFFTAMGFESFAMATALGAVCVGLGLRALRRGGVAAWSAWGAALLLLAHAHAVVAGMVGLHVLLLALVGGGAEAGKEPGPSIEAQPKPRLSVVTGLLWLVVASLPAGALALAAVLEAWGGQAEAGFGQGLGTQRLGVIDQVMNLARCSFGGFSTLGGLLVAALLVFSTLAVLRSRSRADQARHGLIPALWLLAYVVTPFHTAGWAYAQPRLLVPALILPSLTLPWVWRPKVQALAIGAAAILYLGSSTLGAIDAGTALRDQVEAFGTGPERWIMAVVLDPGASPANPWVKTLIDSPSYAHLQGSARFDRRTYNAATYAVRPRIPADRWPPHPPPFIYRSLQCSQPDDCRQRWARLADRVAFQGLAYDATLVVGDAGRLATALQTRGYARPAPARFTPPHPTTLALRLRLPEAVALGPTEIRAGYPDTIGWVLGRRRPPMPPQGEERVELGPLPAGPVTVEVVLQTPAGERLLQRRVVSIPVPTNPHPRVDLVLDLAGPRGEGER